MPGFAGLAGMIGNQPINPFGLPDTTARHLPGLIIDAVHPYWGGGEFIYCKALATIRPLGLVSIVNTVVNNQVVFSAGELPNTANQGRMVGIAMTSATVGQYIWVMITGVMPLNCNASVAADTTFGVAAAGQGGANSAGKQILNARSMVAATQTVTKPGVANSGSLLLNVNNSDGLFIGAYLSGTGIAATTTIVDIDSSGTVITLSLATTAAVNGTVTATYNNATIFYNIVHLNRPFAQGAIT